jgi:hypothetical protein
MPGTLTPAQMFTHELNVVKGWPSPYAVDKTRPIATLGTDEVIYGGRVVSLDTTAKWVLGCADATSFKIAMPCFALANQGDFDIASDVGNISGGNLTALVATGSYEMESTEFTAAETYVPGDCLVSIQTTGINKGRLAKSGTLSPTAAGKTVIGIVSSVSPITNDFKKEVVRFWPVCIPFVGA